MNNMSRSALSQYRNVVAVGNVETANPHKLVQMLYDGLAESLRAAGGAIERSELSSKSAAISKAAGIIDALNSSIDIERGGEIGANLQRLYEYMGRRLTEANLHNDVAALKEIAQINETLLAAWKTIPEQERAGAIAA